MIEKMMYEKAIAFIEQRYPKGWGGAAVMRTDKDHYLISVAPDTFNASTELCIETGAICEAHKLNERITHAMCLVRDDENSPYKVLTPCGICQERLRFYGGDVQVAVTADEPLKFIRLKTLQPFHWTAAYNDLEQFEG